MDGGGYRKRRTARQMEVTAAHGVRRLAEGRRSWKVGWVEETGLIWFAKWITLHDFVF
jgi:hypothetical protein